jgi:hypothetical protein
MLEAKRPHQQWKQKQPQKHKVERPRQQESQHRRGRSQQMRTRRRGLVKRAMKAWEVNTVAKVKVLLMGTVLRRLKEVPKLERGVILLKEQTPSWLNERKWNPQTREVSGC